MQRRSTLRRARLEAGLTQSAVAARIGVHTSDVCTFERGQRDIAPETAAKLEILFGLPADEITARDPDEVSYGVW